MLSDLGCGFKHFWFSPIFGMTSLNYYRVETTNQFHIDDGGTLCGFFHYPDLCTIDSLHGSLHTFVVFIIRVV